MIDIPTLDLAMQAEVLVEPIVKWGSIARTSCVSGTYHFYTSDEKFSALHRHPDQLPDSGCRVAVEPNYSTWPGMAPDLALAGIVRKRWLARHWQHRGVKVIADLNVDPAFREFAFAGLPLGWSAYGVRQQAGIPLDAIEADFEAACRHAGHSSPLFVVFGGWRKVRDLCKARGWRWVAEPMHAARGSVDGTRAWK